MKIEIGALYERLYFSGTIVRVESVDKSHDVVNLYVISRSDKHIREYPAGLNLRITSAAFNESYNEYYEQIKNPQKDIYDDLFAMFA